MYLLISSTPSVFRWTTDKWLGKPRMEFLFAKLPSSTSPWCSQCATRPARSFELFCPYALHQPKHKEWFYVSYPVRKLSPLFRCEITITKAIAASKNTFLLAKEKNHRQPSENQHLDYSKPQNSKSRRVTKNIWLALDTLHNPLAHGVYFSGSYIEEANVHEGPYRPRTLVVNFFTVRFPFVISPKRLPG